MANFIKKILPEDNPANTLEIIYPHQLCAQLGGINPSTLWRWSKAGKIPAPIILPSGRKAWRAIDIQAWLESLPKA